MRSPPERWTAGHTFGRLSPGMRAYVAVTDNDWFRYLAGVPDLDEVNFWQPSGGRAFHALGPGEVRCSSSTPPSARSRVAGSSPTTRRFR